MQVAQGKEDKIGGACDTHDKAKMNTKTYSKYLKL